MKFYTFFTPSHQPLYNKFFLSDFPHDDFSLIAEESPQECASGSYGESGWNKTMRRKLSVIINGLRKNKGDIIVHGDCDIQFFPKNGNIKTALLEELGDKDMAFQRDGARLCTESYMLHEVYCAGFFISRCTDRTIALFEQVIERLEEFSEDQDAINKLLPASGVSYKTLSSRFYTVAMDNDWQKYEGKNSFKIHQDRKFSMLIHHANYTTGLENKIKLLKGVQEFHYGHFCHEAV